MTPPPLPAPPVLSSVPPVIRRASIPRALAIAFFAVGALQFLLAWIVPLHGGDSAAHRIGAVLGATVIWPLVVLGLFSIARRFRNRRSRAIILLVVWSVFVLAHLGGLSRQRVRDLRDLRIAGPDIREALSSLETRAQPAATPAERVAPTAMAPVRTPSAREPVNFDFSRGSDERLIKLIEEAQEERYHAVVAAYIEACQARPADAALALERVKFIEHFVNAEDIDIASAAGDLEAATADLERRFPDAPGTVLHKLDRLFGPEFEAAANRFAHRVDRWPAEERSRFYLMRANASQLDRLTARTRNFAHRSFTAKPTAEAALLLARAAHENKQSAECLRYLTHAAFDAAEPWQKSQKMNLLFELERSDEAAALYDELAATSPFLVNNSETAMRLARSGRIEAARKILRELPMNQWNRSKISRERFVFELEFGTAEQAGSAYRAMRALGIEFDPFLNDRVRLLLKHPRLAWTLDDGIGIVLLGLLLVAVLFAPLVVLVPVHYWSLLRQRRSDFRPRRGPGWGLRQAWIALGALLVTELATLWLLQPEWLRTWWSEAEEVPALSDRSLLLQQSAVWLALTAILTLLLWGAGKWNLFGRGRWTTGRTIGFALGAALLLKIGLLIYALIWPESILAPVASFDPQTRQLCFALVKTVGPLGLIAAIAMLVPILEELLFRGVLLEALAKHIPFGWANALQSLAFAAVHENYRILPFYFAFGFVAGELARRSGSLLPAMIMHACNNLLAALGILAQYRLLGA